MSLYFRRTEKDVGSLIDRRTALSGGAIVTALAALPALAATSLDRGRETGERAVPIASSEAVDLLHP